MNKYGELITPTTLQFVRTLPGSIERVWELITDGEQRKLWFAGGPTELAPGGKLKLVFENGQLSSPVEQVPDKYKEYGDGFISHAKVITCEEPNLFVIEWEGLVTFQLESLSETSTKLTLTHEKLPQDNEVRIGTLAGWHSHLDILEIAVQDQKHTGGFWTTHMALEDEYTKRLAE